MDDGAYHFFIDNSEHEHGSYDSKILDVVTVILEEFFSQEPTVMLYICDSTDHRQAARDRLYHLWFYDYARSHEMTLYIHSSRRILQSSAQAQFATCWFLMTGTDVPKDERKGLKWIHKATFQGYQPAIDYCKEHGYKWY